MTTHQASWVPQQGLLFLSEQLCFLSCRYRECARQGAVAADDGRSVKGANGIVESAADEQLNCRVKGGVLLGFGSADPCTTEAYDTGKFKTYYGRAQAVVYTPETGTIRVEAEGEHSRGEAVIEVV